MTETSYHVVVGSESEAVQRHTTVVNRGERVCLMRYGPELIQQA